mgnify:CR=1 FL=1
MKEKLRQFMIGRYGVDDLSRAQIIVSMVLLLVSTFLSAFFRVNILYWLGLALLIYSYFRILFRSVKALRREPEIFKCEIPGSGKEKQSEKTLGTAQYLPFL